MANLARIVVTVAVCAGVHSMLPRTTVAQDTSGRVPDSARLRALGCGTYGATLQRREHTREVFDALTRVSACPEGPELIATLWAQVTAAESEYVGGLAAVSSITKRPIATAMIQTLSSRSRPTAVRLRALEAFLWQLTGEYGGFVWAESIGETLDARGRVVRVDTTWRPGLSRSSPPGLVRSLDPTLRAEIVAAINRVAADSSDDKRIRLAAAEVAKVLSPRSP
jgi:hypothetical protein